MNGRMIIVTIFFLALCFQQLDSHDKPSKDRRRHRCGKTCNLGRRTERELTRLISKRLERKYNRSLELIKRELKEIKSDTKKAIGRLERERSCPVGFLRFKHHCFQFVMSKTMWRKWKDARDYCQAASANLLYLNSTKKHEFIATYLRENFELHASSVFTSGIFCDKSLIPYSWNPGISQSTVNAEWTWQGKNRGRNRTRDSGDEIDPNTRLVGTDVSKLQWCRDTIPKETLLHNMNSCLILSRTCDWQWSAGKCGQPRPFVCEMELLPRARKCHKC